LAVLRSKNIVEMRRVGVNGFYRVRSGLVQPAGRRRTIVNHHPRDSHSKLPELEQA